jgi:RHS repeat-associated protein
MYSDGAYGPFGEAYAQTGTTDLSYTGMNQDTVSNLYDFPAREYGTQGRWPSPDPSGSSSASPTDPQTWNRYAYVTNSPLRYVDATGMARTSPTLGFLLTLSGALGFGSGPAFGADPFSFGSGPVPGTCVYLNDSGTGVDPQGVDNNSNSSECSANGGYFAPGNANPATISIDPDAGLDPSVDSLVSINGTFSGNSYTSTDFAPGDEFVLIAEQPSGWCTAMERGGTTGIVAGGALFLLGTGEDLTVVGLVPGLVTQASGAILGTVGSVVAGVGFLGKAAGVCQ